MRERNTSGVAYNPSETHSAWIGAFDDTGTITRGS